MHSQRHSPQSTQRNAEERRFSGVVRHSDISEVFRLEAGLNGYPYAFGSLCAFASELMSEDPLRVVNAKTEMTERIEAYWQDDEPYLLNRSASSESSAVND